MQQGSESYKDLDYADDLAALADNIQGAQEMFRLIEDTSAEVGLYVHDC